jgi:hypothetical protein
MNVVDSSCWIEYFNNTAIGDKQRASDCVADWQSRNRKIAFIVSQFYDCGSVIARWSSEGT